jgi:hypothetical protein
VPETRASWVRFNHAQTRVLHKYNVTHNVGRQRYISSLPLPIHSVEPVPKDGLSWNGAPRQLYTHRSGMDDSAQGEVGWTIQPRADGKSAIIDSEPKTVRKNGSMELPVTSNRVSSIEYALTRGKRIVHDRSEEIKRNGDSENKIPRASQVENNSASSNV